MQTSKSQYLNNLLQKLKSNQLPQQTCKFYSKYPEDDIFLFCCLYLKCRKLCYADYMDTGIKLFSACVNFNNPAYTEYYMERAWPDICICTNSLNPTGCCLRSHCYRCKGLAMAESLNYEIQQLSLRFNVHYSWLEMGFASALRLLNRK